MSRGVIGGARHALVVHPSADLYGSDRVLLETVSALIEQGWVVTASVPADGPLVPLLRERGADVRICPSPVLRKSALSPRGMARLVLATLRALPPGTRLIRRCRPHVLVVNTVTIPLWTFLARVLRIRVLVHVHEAEGSASPLKQRALAFPLLFANAVVANSRFSRDVLADAFGRLGRRVTVIYNGVDGPQDPTPPRPRIDGPARLLYVGRLSPRKGPDIAIEAVGRLHRAGADVRLDIVGDVFPGYEWYDRELRDLARRECVQERVHFHGFVKDIWPEVAATDVMIVPSTIDEPFGNTAVEAVLGARPLVVSATSGLLEAADGAAGARAVPPGDAQALADSVGEILAGWTHFAGLAESGAAQAAHRYSPARYRQAMADQIARVAR